MDNPELHDMAMARRLIEVMLERCKSDDAFASKITWRDRMAVCKSLESSMILMGVVHRLMLPPAALNPGEAEARLRMALDEIKTAARGAYQAGLLLTGIA